MALLGGILFLGLLHNSGNALGVTLPGGYSVTVAWDRNPSPAVTGYRVHYGVTSGNYSSSVAVGDVTTNTFPGLASGTAYFFAVTALDTNGLESAFSNEITVMPGQPTLQIIITANREADLTVTGEIGHTYDIQATRNFTAWTVIGTVTLGPGGSATFTDTNAANLPKRFYRTHDTQP